MLAVVLENMFHEDLRRLMDEYAHLVYALSRSFPKYEIYGITSQLRRSALSVVLNYVEGYARKRDSVHKNFLEISYGSLKESRYLLEFCFKEGLLAGTDYTKAVTLADSVGAMLWGTIEKL